jgi:hypothetical protein
MRSIGALWLVGAAGVLWSSVGLAQAPAAASPSGQASPPAPAADLSPPAPGGVAPAADLSPPAPGGVAPAADLSPPPPGGVAAAPASAAEASVGTDTYASSYETGASANKGKISGYLGWTFNVPLGSVRDFAAVVSPLGFEIMIEGWLAPQFSIGATGEWATYVDDRPKTTYQVTGGAVTATAYNRMQTAAARMFGHYYFLERGSVIPYIGPHVGVSWTSFDSQVADLSLWDTRASFAFGGEVGAKIPFGRNDPVALINLRYSVGLQSEFLAMVDNVQSLGLTLGVGF